MLTRVAPATKAEGYRGLFAENVVGLWIRAFGLDGVEVPDSFDSRTVAGKEGGYLYEYKYSDVAGS